jgi:hypothetical protein
VARKTGQIIGCGPRTWLVRVYVGRDAETKKRKYLNKTIHGGLRDAQAHLNKMLGERDRGRNLDSSKQMLNQYLHRWLAVCAKARLRAKSLQDYEGLPAGDAERASATSMRWPRIPSRQSRFPWLYWPPASAASMYGSWWTA